jgi:hypothetical protein
MSVDNIFLTFYGGKSLRDKYSEFWQRGLIFFAGTWDKEPVFQTEKCISPKKNAGPTVVRPSELPKCRHYIG